ncbi:MAG: PPOX class F420-dependent oxidoreductase [Chloroflexi bacterium]|nr:PPOX class F420-dependent oxidoreductase [Chloroflexota bacterium]
MMTTTYPGFDALAGHTYIALTTFRGNDTAVPTPVWSARDGDRLVLLTLAPADKLKRLSNDAHVRVASSEGRSKLLGTEIEARGRILTPEEHPGTDGALTSKYGWQKRASLLAMRLRGSEIAYIELRRTDGELI